MQLPKKPVKKPTPRKSSKASDLDDVLLAFRRVMTEALRVEAKRLGQSLSHLEVLKIVAEKGNPSLKDVARGLRITSPSASVLVEALVRNKLVTRDASASDRRTVRIGLTPKANQLFVSLHEKKFSIFKKMLSKLNKPDQKKLAEILTLCLSK